MGATNAKCGTASVFVALVIENSLSLKLCATSRNSLVRNTLWWSSCHHIWRQVIVPPDFFVAKPTEQAGFTFPMWT